MGKVNFSNSRKIGGIVAKARQEQAPAKASTFESGMPSKEYGDIPVIDIREQNIAENFAMLEPAANSLIDSAANIYTARGIKIADLISKKWLVRNQNPYLEEMNALSEKIKRPGLHMLNMSYEWACTTASAPHDGSQVMLRVLDWPLDGLGKNLVVLKCRGNAGEWTNITWPGFVGTITAMAKGRFCAAINQPPMEFSRFGAIAARAHPMGGLLFDWLAKRSAIWRSRSLPPAHLLRYCFETALTYNEAVEILCKTPVTVPVFFAVSGTEAGEGCVIERLPNEYKIRVADPVIGVANEWLAFDRKGTSIVGSSHQRRVNLENALISNQSFYNMNWLEWPVLNNDTRVAAMMNAGSGELSLVGIEETGRATAILHQFF